jgi:hypothetical protein
MSSNLDAATAGWGDLKALLRRYPGVFKRTRAYQLRAEGKLRTKKLGGRTIWEFASADELIESLPSDQEDSTDAPASSHGHNR